MKGIIYTRVSSDEQVKGTSLETQKDACIQYCKDKGIEVEMIFCEEGESAKTIDRKEFLSAIDYCRKNTGKIEAFVVWKLDRFSREPMNQVVGRIQTLRERSIGIRSLTESWLNTSRKKILFQASLCLALPT